MKSGFLLMIFVAFLFILSGCTINSSLTQENKDKANIQIKDNAMIENSTQYAGKVLAGKKTPYLEFNEADYKKALSENKIILLNFYANWCPICKAEEPQIFSAFNELELSNAVGFRVNYKDSQTDAQETQLAKEFQIPYQHTKVIIKNGQKVLKETGTWDKARYIKEIEALT